MYFIGRTCDWLDCLIPGKKDDLVQRLHSHLVSQVSRYVSPDLCPVCICITYVLTNVFYSNRPKKRQLLRRRACLKREQSKISYRIMLQPHTNELITVDLFSFCIQATKVYMKCWYLMVKFTFYWLTVNWEEEPFVITEKDQSLVWAHEWRGISCDIFLMFTPL